MFGMSDRWSEIRLEVTYTEARAVIESQRDVISDIDDKAIRTVRLNAVIVGIVVAAAQLAGASMFHFPIPSGGTLSLFLSLGAGLITYSESDLYLGPNKAYIEQLSENGFDGRDWEIDLLVRMGDWITANHEHIQWNGRLLFLTQTLLFLGITGIGLSVVI